jgi:hypothetical protein
MQDLQFTIYVALHKKSVLPNLPFIKSVQGGAVFTTDVFAGITDNTGQNISHLNKHFSELTAMYSIVYNNINKNTAYWGLAHYRRYFCPNLSWLGLKQKAMYKLPATENSFKKIFTPKFVSYLNNVLTPNTIILPNKISINNAQKQKQTVKQLYVHHHHAQDWQELAEVIKKIQPQYYNSFLAVENQTEFLLYNMLLAHNNVWKDYADWLFSILLELVKTKRVYENEYQERVYSFLSERLLQVYFYHHGATFNFVHLPVAFLTT